MTGPSGVAPATIEERGRRKAYRPMEPAARRAALDRALAAYERGDWFAAHELLEPAWLGSPDPAERALYSGLIKLSAAYVHAVRGGDAGVVKNLRGARDRLAEGASAAAAIGLDAVALIGAIDERLDGDPANQPAPAIVRTAR
jgi:predicted metal-dependent hydrolase